MAVKVLVEAGVTVTDRRMDHRMDHRMDPGETVLAVAEAAQVVVAQVVAVPVAAAHSAPMAHFPTSTA